MKFAGNVAVNMSGRLMSDFSVQTYEIFVTFYTLPKFGRNFKFMLDFSISSDGMFVTFYTLQNLVETPNLC